MKLQANYKGAWRNVLIPASLNGDEEHLKAIAPGLCQGAHGLRIVELHGATWMWNAEAGWYRPHWYQIEERHEL